MNRMRGNYPAIEEARLEGVLVNYERLFRQVGWDRFAAGVDRCVFESELLFFPSIKEFKPYIPDPPEKEQSANERAAWERDMRAKRAQHPDEFFGEADVKLMMGLLVKARDEKNPRPSDSEIIEACFIAREQYGYTSAKQVITGKEFQHFED